MYEIRSVKQHDPSLKLRWFTSENCDADLYIWEEKDSGKIVQFQFYFNRNFDEQVVEWKSSSFCFAVVETGEKGFFKSSPLLQRIDSLDIRGVLNVFKSIAEGVDEYVCEFIIARFRERLARAG